MKTTDPVQAHALHVFPYGFWQTINTDSFDFSKREKDNSTDLEWLLGDLYETLEKSPVIPRDQHHSRKVRT